VADYAPRVCGGGGLGDRRGRVTQRAREPQGGQERADERRKQRANIDAKGPEGLEVGIDRGGTLRRRERRRDERSDEADAPRPARRVGDCAAA
jgi:hypothetical protein